MSHPCPTCTRPYDTSRGLNHHIARGCPVAIRLDEEIRQRRKRRKQADKDAQSIHQSMDYDATVRSLRDTAVHDAQPAEANDQLIHVPPLGHKDRSSVAGIINYDFGSVNENNDIDFNNDNDHDNDEATDTLHTSVVTQTVPTTDAILQWDMVFDDDDDAHEFPPGYDSDEDDGSDDEDIFFDALSQQPDPNIDHNVGEDQNNHFSTSFHNSSRTDPFHPDNFNEDNMRTYPPKNTCVNMSTSELAQLDLLNMLRKSGCPINMYDKIIDWVVHYSKKNNKIWTDSLIFHRDPLLKYLSEKYEVQNREPIMKPVTLPDRIISLPTFSFVSEIMSMLQDPDIMNDKNIADGYDVMTGKLKDGQFWDPGTIDEENLDATPTPMNRNSKIGEVVRGTKFQKSVDRFCTEPHHMPIPLVFFYDKANLDFNGGLASSPLLFTLGFLKSSARARILFWRLLAIIPNMSIGKGRSNTKSADEKASDHHKVLRVAFSELERICNQGGFKTTFRGKEVVLKFWIHFVVGDTEGHNDLCGHFNAHSNGICPVRNCMCPPLNLSSAMCEKCEQWIECCVCPPGGEIQMCIPCEPITLDDVKKCEGDAEKLRQISQRPIDNVFDHLPMGNILRGIFASCPFETLHVFDQGLLKYLCESLNDMIGLKDANKQDKDKLDGIFRVMSRYLERNSERDFPRRALRFAWTDGTRLTATERRGNCLVILLVLETKDGRRLIEKNLSKVGSAVRPTIKLLKDALREILCYEKWCTQENCVGEVLNSANRIIEVMMKLKKAYPRWNNSDAQFSSEGWNLPKFHGAMQMWIQIIADGDGSNWNSSHGERFHKEFSNKNAKLTQLRYASLGKQMADRHYESIIGGVASADNRYELLHTPYVEDEDKNLIFDITVASVPREMKSYERIDLPKVDKSDTEQGEYHLDIPGKSTLVGPSVECAIAWKNRDKQKSRGTCFPELLFAISNHAVENNWFSEVSVTGFTSFKKQDSTTLSSPRYRCDTNYRGRPWRDWASVRTFPDGVVRPDGVLCPGQICGVVRFNNVGFPTPKHLRLRNHSTTQEGSTTPLEIDSSIYVVVRVAAKTFRIHDSFIETFKLLHSERGSLYILPLSDIVGPLAVVPNIHTNHRFHQTQDEWMVVQPCRMWGDHFGSTIEWGDDNDEDDEE